MYSNECGAFHLTRNDEQIEGKNTTDGLPSVVAIHKSYVCTLTIRKLQQLQHTYWARSLHSSSVIDNFLSENLYTKDYKTSMAIYEGKTDEDQDEYGKQ